MSFNVCVIGCGWVADAMHGPAYLKYCGENKEIKFTGCCDIDDAKAQAFRAKYGFTKAYTDWNEMLSTEKPDAVCLLVPVQFLAPIAEKILGCGIPLLLEKPPGRTKEEVLHLIEIAEKNNVPNMVAFNRRYAPLIRKTRELIEAGGSLQSISYKMLRSGRYDDDFSATAVHAIDAVRYISGSDYNNIRVIYRKYSAVEKDLTDFHLSCIMENGTAAHISISPLTGINKEGAVACLRDRTVILDYLGNPINPEGRLTHLCENKIMLDVTGADMLDGVEPFEREGFYFENKLFFDSIIAGKKPSGNLQDSLQSVIISDSIRNRKSEILF